MATIDSGKGKQRGSCDTRRLSGIVGTLRKGWRGLPLWVQVFFIVVDVIENWLEAQTAIKILEKHIQLLIDRYEWFNALETKPEQFGEMFSDEWTMSMISPLVAKGAGHITQACSQVVTGRSKSSDRLCTESCTIWFTARLDSRIVGERWLIRKVGKADIPSICKNNIISDLHWPTISRIFSRNVSNNLILVAMHLPYFAAHLLTICAQTTMRHIKLILHSQQIISHQETTKPFLWQPPNSVVQRWKLMIAENNMSNLWYEILLLPFRLHLPDFYSTETVRPLVRSICLLYIFWTANETHWYVHSLWVVWTSDRRSG